MYDPANTQGPIIRQSGPVDPPPAYGQPPTGPMSQPPVYGQPPTGPMGQPPIYGQPPTGPMGQPPVYGQAPLTYNQPLTGPVGQPPLIYGQPPTGPMGSQPLVYGQSGYGQPAYAPPQPVYMATPVIVVRQQNDGLAVALEVIGGLFGFYGIGWLVAGFTTPGIILLVCGLVYDFLVVFIGWPIIGVLTAATFGIGGLLFFCPLIINIAVLVTSTLMLNSKLKARSGLTHP